MLNFHYDIGTEIYFGKGQLSALPGAIQKVGVQKVLLVYGGNSIRRSGLYDQVKDLLAQARIQVEELGGVEPNPRVTSVNRGAQLCREKGLQAVLAVGGGSAIDCAKAIAAAVYYDGDAWDLVLQKAPVTQALPIFSVVTLAATGSEMDRTAVISNLETNDKLPLKYDVMRPTASILDPTYTYTVPRNQTAAGTADIFSHLVEGYFAREEAYLQDRMSEALMKTCVHFGPIALAKPEDYEARANLMWTASLAINELLAYGKGTAWSVHSMEHQLSAYYDITHGVGLAILTPAWMRHVLQESTLPKFVEYGVNVFGVDPALPQEEIAQRAIQATETFLFDSLGLPRTLRAVGIGEEHLEEMAQKAATPALYESAFVSLGAEDVLAIYRACL